MQFNRVVAVLFTVWSLATAAYGQDAPVVTAGRDGFRVKSADDAYSLRLGGYVQVDGRFGILRKPRRRTIRSCFAPFGRFSMVCWTGISRSA